MNTAIYVRNDEDGKTLNELVSFAKSKGWNVIKFYVDNGFSGLDDNRPQLQQLLKDTLSNNDIDVVLVEGAKHLSRDFTSFRNIKEKLNENGVKLYSTSYDAHYPHTFYELSAEDLRTFRELF
ncbi:recombinase family protein [Fictibacillus sp. Mic-4]|uniref:recombinase family protein n=1 Tax=Fictibacillus sp. Mic-4 TaxID=3132826 RepID=UPI003CF68092